MGSLSNSMELWHPRAEPIYDALVAIGLFFIVKLIRTKISR